MTDAAGAGLFQEWLDAMHPRLSRFEDLLLSRHIVHEDSSKESFRHDYSRESPERLEQLVLDRRPSQAAFIDDSDTDFIDGATRYIGETLQRAYGGGRHLGDVASFASFESSGRPFIQLDTLDRTPITPFFLLTAVLHRRTGQMPTKVCYGQARHIEERSEKEGPGWQPQREPVR